MPLRLFGGHGGRVRTCPACEHEVAAEASFCPSCYMVFRPEGAAELREFLGGGRIPADVYLLRKMQAQDPDTGPVVLEPPVKLSAPPPAETSAPDVPASPPIATEPAVSQKPEVPVLSAPSVQEPPPVSDTSPAPPVETPPGERESQRAARGWKGALSLFKFDPPVPPPARTAEEVPALLAWMLEKDPVIPNNLELLETIHAGTFPEGAAAPLGYQQHLLLQIGDDLSLHPTQETLNTHLSFLAAGYRRAAGAYHLAVQKGEDGKNAALWQMASTASRLRVEAWVFRTRYGVSPDATRLRRSRTSRTPTD